MKTGTVIKKPRIMNAPEGYLTTGQVMKKLGITSSTLYRIIEKGNFSEKGESIKFHGKRLFLETAVKRYLEKQISACY